MENISDDLGIKIAGIQIKNMNFADDIDLLSDTKTKLQQITDEADAASKRWGLGINTEKTKVMVVSKEQQNMDKKINEEPIEQVKEFK